MRCRNQPFFVSLDHYMLDSFPQALAQNGGIPKPPVNLQFNMGSDFEFDTPDTTSNNNIHHVQVPLHEQQSVQQSPVEVIPENTQKYVKMDATKSVKIHNITREELVIRRIFDDPTIQSRIVEYLDPDIFTGPFKNVIRAIKSFNSTFKRFPGAQELMVGFPDTSVERNAMDRLMNYGVDTISNDLSAVLLKNYFREMLTEKIIIKAAVSMKNTESIGDIMGLVKELEKSINFNLDINVGLSARSDMPEIIRRLNESVTAVPSAIYAIREFTSGDDDSQIKKDAGGWYRKSLSLFLGQPNVGKTIMLCNEAAYAYATGHNVLYVSLEMGEEFIHQRIIANVCDINLKQVKKQNPDDLSRLYETRLEQGITKPGNVIVRRLPTSTTVVNIDNLIQEVQRTHNIRIDILFVDYIGIMKPVKRANTVDNMNMYTMGKEVAEQLRDLADLYQIPVVTASQLTRDGYANLQASIKDTAGSAGINDVADFMVTITQDALLKAHNMFFHTVLKSRFGGNGQTFLTVVDYSKMRVRSAEHAQYEKYRQAISSSPELIKNFNITQAFPDPDPQPVKATVNEDKREIKIPISFGVPDKTIAIAEEGLT